MVIMTSKKQGQLTSSTEWAKHLRKYGKKVFWHQERSAETLDINSQVFELSGSCCNIFPDGTNLLTEIEIDAFTKKLIKIKASVELELFQCKLCKQVWQKEAQSNSFTHEKKC